MKRPSFLKRMLSYLYPIPLEVREGQHNEFLEVALSRGRYQLNTENAIYSFEDLYDNYYSAFKQLPLDKMGVKDVLILGFGMGSIPAMLEKNFKQEYYYTGVEIDEEVIDLAYKYVVNELSSPIEMVCADAAIFTLTCQQKYDLICLDVFLDDAIPAQFETVDYLRQVAELLNPNGVLILNRLAYEEADLEATRVFYEQSFKLAFPDASHIPLRHNWMLLNFDVGAFFS